MLALDYSYDPVSVCLCQSVSLTSRRSVETSGRIELGFFGTGAYFNLSYTVLTAVCNLVLNAGVRKFRHGTSIVATRCQLRSRKADAKSVTDWTVIGQLS